MGWNWGVRDVPRNGETVIELSAKNRSKLREIFSDLDVALARLELKIGEVHGKDR